MKSQRDHLRCVAGESRHGPIGLGKAKYIHLSECALDSEVPADRG